MNTALFHAYIVSGTRRAAQEHVGAQLAGQGFIVQANPDYLFAEHVSFAVDDARALRAWQELSPLGERKVCVICTDFITPEAQNALLKTFEEPVPNTHLFFILPNADILLPTFLSRVRHTHVHADSYDMAEAAAFLKMSVGERMEQIKKMTAKSDDDDASAEVRARALALVESLEQLYAERVAQGERGALVASATNLLRFKKYLYTPGASVKAILETIALTQ